MNIRINGFYAKIGKSRNGAYIIFSYINKSKDELIRLVRKLERDLPSYRFEDLQQSGISEIILGLSMRTEIGTLRELRKLKNYEINLI